MFTRRQFVQQALTSSSLLALGVPIARTKAPTGSGFAENHQVLILDTERERGGQQSLLVLEIESGKTVAEAELGYNTSVAVAPKGRVASVISYRHLDFYNSSDLKRLDRGLLPSTIPRFGYQEGASVDSQLSPTGQELIVQGPIGKGLAHLRTTALNCVKRELDRDGHFMPFGKTVQIPRSYIVRFVRVADWPLVHVYNGNLGLLIVVDVSRGEIRSRLFLGDHPGVENADPAELEKADTDLIFRLRARGTVIACGDRYAYYIPQQYYSEAGQPSESGFLKKIDLGADAPKVVCKGRERQGELSAGLAAVSPSAGNLFILCQASSAAGGRHQPARCAKVFRTNDLAFQCELQLSITACRGLVASLDGKYIYALDTDHAKLAVIDAVTARQVKVIENVGKYPRFMLAIRERKAESE